MTERPDVGGRIVLLNGTSSSGKSTLARALQDTLPEPWTEVGIDRLVSSLPGRYLRQPLWSEVFRYVPRDDSDDGSFPIETGPAGAAPDQRHAPDRGEPGCRRPHEVVHRWCAYDVEVDTATMSPAECAEVVADALAARTR